MKKINLNFQDILMVTFSLVVLSGPANAQSTKAGGAPQMTINVQCQTDTAQQQQNAMTKHFLSFSGYVNTNAKNGMYEIDLPILTTSIYLKSKGYDPKSFKKLQIDSATVNSKNGRISVEGQGNVENEDSTKSIGFSFWLADYATAKMNNEDHTFEAQFVESVPLKEPVVRKIQCRSL